MHHLVYSLRGSRSLTTALIHFKLCYLELAHHYYRLKSNNAFSQTARFCTCLPNDPHPQEPSSCHLFYPLLVPSQIQLACTNNVCHLTLDSVDSLSQAANILAGDSSNRDTSVLGSVDGVLLGQLVHLLRCQASVGEHADLAGDVGPVVLGAERLELLLEKRAHGDDAVSHALDLAEPLLVEGRVVEDLSRNTGAVDRGVGVQRADQDLDLGVHALLLLGRFTDNGEGTSTLTIETHVLGERLGQAGVVALLDKVAQRKGILVGITAGEALVGHVEEDIVVTSLDGSLNCLPLFGSGVDTGRIVGAGVEEEHAALGSGVDIVDHTIKVQANRVLVVVAVLLDLQPRVLEDSSVVGPGRGGNVDLLVAGVPAGEEFTTDPQGTGAGDGLCNNQAVEGGAVLAVGQFSSGARKLRHTSDAGVFLVHARRNDLVLSLEDRGKDVWLSLVITVGTNTCVNIFSLGRVCGIAREGSEVEGCVPRLIFLSKESALNASVIPKVSCYVSIVFLSSPK